MTTTKAPAAQAFYDALLRRDFEALQAALKPQVEFRALIPGEVVRAATAAEVAQLFRQWFGDKTDLKGLYLSTETLIDRLLVQYRLRFHKGKEPFVVEQRICCTVEDGKLAALDLGCTGCRAEGAETAAKGTP